MRDDLGIAVYTKHQLREIVRPDRKSVEDLCKFFGKNHIARNLTHHVDLKSPLAPLQPLSRHFRDNPLSFLDCPAERNHEFYVRQAHHISHLLHRPAFQGEAVAISLIVVAGGSPESKHRIFFLRLIPMATDEVGVLIGFEVAESDDDVFWIEGCPDHRNALRQLVDEELGFVRVARREPADFRSESRVFQAIEVD